MDPTKSLAPEWLKVVTEVKWSFVLMDLHIFVLRNNNLDEK